ncbi:unnamed protein product [Spodoptera littoralis]|uniref:Phenoloxidase-activating factor 2 n=1 Tax=Spodoptera littoralis TaxID=7109 RepID=A0A9P0I3F8_SPOLI|nr:unnamed protein product [Spodoptera littoralis]CAH1638748.1 unnamed protein product [Spodoptera littoralis]
MRWSTITFILLPIIFASTTAEWSWGGKEDSKPADELHQNASPLLQGEQLPEAQEKNFESNSTVLDDIVDELVSSKQGRSLGGFDDVYSDPTIKEALDSGDDAEARNLIKGRLCTLGLIQCEDEDSQEKRTYLSPDEVIYAQPVDIKPIGKPIASIPVRGPPRAYGPPQPMSYRPRPQKIPPKRVGYGGNVRPGFSEKYGVAGGNFQFSQNSYNAHESNFVTKSPIYATPGPYAYENAKPAYNKYPSHSDTKTDTVVQQHIHHHYVHEDNKDPKVIIKPVAVPVGSVGQLNSQSLGSQSLGSQSFGSQSFGLQSSDIISAGGDYSSITSGGFKPMSGGFHSDTKPIYESDTIYGSQYGHQSNKVGHNGNILTQSLPNQFNNNAFEDQKYGNGLGSYASQSNEFYKKELHVGSQNNIYNQGPSTFGQSNGYAENYHEAKAQNFDCVCVNYDQCPSQEVIGRRDDLYLPIDPRNKGSEIAALTEEQLDNLNKTDIATATAESAANATEIKKLSKRETKEETPSEAAKEAEPRSPRYPGFNEHTGHDQKHVEPTFGVSFALPQGPQSSNFHPFNPHLRPFSSAIMAGGINLGLAVVNPVFSLQVTKTLEGPAYPPQYNFPHYPPPRPHHPHPPPNYIPPPHSTFRGYHDYEDDSDTYGGEDYPHPEYRSLHNEDRLEKNSDVSDHGTHVNRSSYSRSLDLPSTPPRANRGYQTVRFPETRRKREIDVGNMSVIIEERQGYFGRPPVQQCRPNQVCCRRPLQPQAANKGQCGIRHSQGINGRIKTPAYVDGESEFGEYPWQTAILKKDPKESVYVCGGTLIDGLHILTAAHCVKSYKGFELRVRLGEWDVNRDVEFYPYIERDIVSVHVHPLYYAGTLDNDLAILKMDHPVEWTKYPHISPACLPDKYTDYSGQRCWTTGWGKDAFGDYGKYQNILKEVDVPILSHGQCQQQLRQTRLGYNYELNPGFTCAGGEEGKDACKGDGGGPLVCERSGTWQIVGVVSWGIGCGQPGVPGVYVKVAHYLDWISQITGKFSPY